MKRCIFIFILAGVVPSVFAQSRAFPDSTFIAGNPAVFGGQLRIGF